MTAETASIVACLAVAAAPALAGYAMNHTATPAPTYATTLNFDEPGGPTGIAVPADSWAESHALAQLISVDGFWRVEDFSGQPGQSWLGTGNSFAGYLGLLFTFEGDITEFSTQIWDPSGPPSPFGGGAVVYLFDDETQVASFPFTPAWGAVGDEWIDITTSNTDAFDQILILGNGFNPTTYVDNVSWNAAPVVPTCVGDIDANGTTDVFDFNIFAPAFGTSLGDPGFVEAADLNNDDVIDVYDFNLFAPDFGCAVN